MPAAVRPIRRPLSPPLKTRGTFHTASVPGRSSTFGSALESLIAVRDRGKQRIEGPRPQAPWATDNSPMISRLSGFVALWAIVLTVALCPR